MSEANYNGRQPNNTAYIKNFVLGVPANLWKIMEYTKLDGTKETVITPSSSKFENVYIPGDLFVDGSIINPSDAILKKNITPLNIEVTEKIMNLKPSSFEFKDDPSNNIYPLATVATGTNDVYVGRIRKDINNNKKLHVFCVADNIRKGAATDAVQIVEALIERNDSNG